MLKKQISALLVFTVALVMIAPPRVFAQTPQPATSVTESNVPAQPAPKPDLKKLLASEVAKIKAGPATEADFKRLEQARQNQLANDPANPTITRKGKIILTLILVLMAGGLVVAIKHRCKAPKPCPVIDSTDYSYNDY